MIDSIVTILVGLVCIILGISHIKGHISSLHSYHRKRVSEEDRLPFGRIVGLGTIIIGTSLIVFGALTLIADQSNNPVFITVGTIIMVSGLAIGLAIAFYAMIKYNKGIF